jgi:tripartite-type tricarboxylate transporter receptor subunit TctC
MAAPRLAGVPRRSILAGAALAAVLPRALAQSWPAKPIRLLLGYAPGGGADVTARELAPQMSRLLGQQVVIDYKPGASGTIAAAEVARSGPDGYTLGLLDNAPMAIVPALRNPGYDPQKNFTPIGMVTQLPQVLVANTAVPAARSRELIELMRKQPGKLNHASGGSGSVSHLAAELYKARSNTFALHVPYRGGAPAITALIAGEVQFAFLTYSVTAPFIKSGQLKALGVTSAARLPQLPDVPTVAEDGLPGYEVPGWFVLAAPAGLPPAIAQALQNALVEAVTTPAVVQRLEATGQIVAAGKVDPVRTIAAELATWRKLFGERKLAIEM